MKKYPLYCSFAAFISLFFILSSCDKFEEDSRPLLAATLYLKNDNYTTKINQAIQLQVLANDSVTNRASVTFGSPKHGTLQETGTPGQVFYQPEHNFTGTDSVNYQVCIGSNCISAKVSITVLPDSANCMVSITDDSISVFQNQTSTINILQNDIACSYKPVISRQAQSGQASLNSNNQLMYTPNPGFTGTDEVHYALGTLTGKVTIKVKPAQANCTLTANPDVVTLLHGQPYDSTVINVLANDVWCPNAPTATINLVSQSMYGSVQVVNYGSGQKILYSTTTSLHNVTDNFQYRICQGGNCSTSSVTINIQ